VCNVGNVLVSLTEFSVIRRSAAFDFRTHGKNFGQVMMMMMMILYYCDVQHFPSETTVDFFRSVVSEEKKSC